MQEREKHLFIEERCNSLRGCVIEDIKIERHRDIVFLVLIYLKSPTGDKFVIRPYDWEQLHVVQTYWGDDKDD